MKERLPPIERAFELARSGSMSSVQELERTLSREGYARNLVEGRSIRRQLKELIAASKPGDLAIATEDLTSSNDE